MQLLKSAFVLCELRVELLFQMDATFVEKTDFFPFTYFDNFTKINQKYTYGLLLYTVLCIIEFVVI